MRPYMNTSAIGNHIMAEVVTKFEAASGFSKGCAEFIP